MSWFQDENLKAQMQNFLLSTQSQQEITGLDGKVGFWKQGFRINFQNYIFSEPAKFYNSGICSMNEMCVFIYFRYETKVYDVFQCNEDSFWVCVKPIMAYTAFLFRSTRRWRRSTAWKWVATSFSRSARSHRSSSTTGSSRRHETSRLVEVILKEYSLMRDR